MKKDIAGIMLQFCKREKRATKTSYPSWPSLAMSRGTPTQNPVSPSVRLGTILPSFSRSTSAQHSLSMEVPLTLTAAPPHVQSQASDHFKERCISCYLIPIFSEHLILSNILPSLPLITGKTHWSDVHAPERPLLFPTLCLIKNLNHLSAS